MSIVPNKSKRWRTSSAEYSLKIVKRQTENYMMWTGLLSLTVQIGGDHSIFVWPNPRTKYTDVLHVEGAVGSRSR